MKRRPTADRGGGAGAVRAKRSLGQNFLVDKNVARKIVAALKAAPGDLVLEIGPGRGALTHVLADLPGVRLAALEKDAALAAALKAELPGAGVVVADALGFAWESLASAGPLRIIGNLPYNVASPIIWELVARCPYFARAVFMIQREVAERLCAMPGSGAYGGLTAWVRSFVAPELLFRVGPEVFRPRPKVESAVVAFTPLPAAERAADPQNLAAVIKQCFTWRRKQLQNILKAFPAGVAERFFAAEQIKPTARPEELSPRKFQALAACYRSVAEAVEQAAPPAGPEGSIGP